MGWERLKEAVDRLYKRPKQLSDPMGDFSQEELDDIIALPDEEMTVFALMCIFQSYCPAGDYHESVYFLPIAIKFIETRGRDGEDVLPNFMIWLDENRQALKKDGLWRLTARCLCGIVEKALLRFELKPTTDKPRPRYYPVRCALLDEFLKPSSVKPPVMSKLVLRKVLREHFSSIDSYPAAAWLVWLGTSHESHSYLSARLADAEVRERAQRLILEQCHDHPINAAFWNPILQALDEDTAVQAFMKELDAVALRNL